MANYALIAPAQQWVDANGNPLSGYRLFTYANRTSTKKTTTTTADASVANANPITLDSNGRCANNVFGSTGAYTLLLAPPGADDPPLSTTWSRDDVSGINDVGTSVADQWIASGFTPTFISATSFSVAGDQTSVLHPGRRLKTVNSGGTGYSTIKTSSFGAGITTIVVTNDGLILDSGITSVSYGIISWNNSSWPIRPPTVETLTSGTAATYTTLANARALYVELVGPGAGSGGVAGTAAQSAVSGAGAGGAYCAKMITSPAASYTYTVGAAGTGGAAGNNNGTAGTSTTFTDGAGVNLVAASGGLGSGSAASAGNVTNTGATGGTASGGDVNYTGGDAGARSVVGGVFACLPTSGAAPVIGGGVRGAVAGAGVVARVPGEGGGSASTNDATNKAGADGFRGQITITTYY